MRDDLNRKIVIHCCKDRTLTYRNRLQPVFNGVALPVFSVDSVDQARELIKLVSNRQYTEHPQNPGDTWWKIDLGPAINELEIEHLGTLVRPKLREAYERILSHEG